MIFCENMMKKEFVIFYSWMSERPKEQNIKYIRGVLEGDCKKLEKKLGIKIKIDSDSRGEDGSKSIDENVLKKIAGCHIFIGDITPIYPQCAWKWWLKPTPNPNVMYELGFAVSSLGWNRCIMVWNLKYGNLSKAPFDIRNHTTIKYRKGKQELSFYRALKSKIENYDEYVREWRIGKERFFDAEKYYQITQMCSERDLVDSIDGFLTNQVYNSLEFNWWDNLYYYYHHYPDNRFVDEELHQAYLKFLDELKRMTLFAATYNEQIRHSNRPDDEVGIDEWRREEIYRIRDPYQYLDESKAAAYQTKIDKEFYSLIPSVMDSYKAFRDLIRKKLLV